MEIQLLIPLLILAGTVVAAWKQLLRPTVMNESKKKNV
jgi:hypothetical protein